MSCAKSELCIFDAPMPQIVIDSAAFETIFPINTITGNTNADVEFNIIASNTEYLDLNDTMLFVELKVVKNDGKDLEVTSEVYPSNCFFHTLFKDIVLSMNNERIEGGNNNHAQKALIETIINYGSDTKKTSLDSIGYNPDKEKRKAWIQKSTTFRMCGSLQLDFFDQPKYLIPGVNVHLRLQRSKDSFCLSAKDLKPKIILNDVKLFIRRVKVDPSVLIGHQLGLNSQNARYPIRKTQFVSYTIARGSLSFYKEQIFGDNRLPKFILITFQNTSQYTSERRGIPSF